jgi:hypothetical protein
MVHLKRSIIEVKADENCPTNAVIISIARLTNDPNYSAGIPELTRFQEHFKEYRIVVFGGFKCEDIMNDGQVESENTINLIYDDVSQHYHVIENLTGALSRKYVCKVCNRGCESGVTHKGQETCSDYINSSMSIRQISNPVRSV